MNNNNGVVINFLSKYKLNKKLKQLQDIYIKVNNILE